jgi:hypothetical protein
MTHSYEVLFLVLIGFIPTFTVFATQTVCTCGRSTFPNPR